MLCQVFWNLSDRQTGIPKESADNIFSVFSFGQFDIIVFVLVLQAKIHWIREHAHYIRWVTEFFFPDNDIGNFCPYSRYQIICYDNRR